MATPWVPVMPPLLTPGLQLHSPHCSLLVCHPGLNAVAIHLLHLLILLMFPLSQSRLRGNGAASVTPASSSRPLLTQHTHGKKLAQRGDCRILRRCSVSPSPQLCRCLPKRRRAPTHGRRQHSWWSEPSPPGGTARLAPGTPRRRPPLSSGPTSVWRQPSLSAALHGRSRTDSISVRRFALLKEL